jgi:hypothetical protein
MLFMTRLAGICTLAAFASVATAAAPPVLPITSNDAAARGVIRTLDSFSDAFRPISVFVDPMRRYSELALATLASATTTEALLTARGGVTVACPGGGSINAKLSRDGSHVLKMFWSACVLWADAGQPSYTGHSDFTLPADTLRPAALLKMRFGSAVEPFVEANTYLPQSETDPTTVIRKTSDVLVIGTMPMTRYLDLPAGLFVGNFDYRLNGSSVETIRSTYTDPDSAPFQQTIYQTATDFRLSGSTGFTEENWLADQLLTAHRGSFTTAIETTYQPLQTMQAYEVFNLGVHLLFDGRHGISTLTANGKIEFEWPASLNGTCGNGVYSFSTIVPIRQYNVFHVQGRDQGKVRINQTAVATFANGDPPAAPEWYIPQPDERPTAITVKMGTTGTFTHNSYVPSWTLQDIMKCPASN